MASNLDHLSEDTTSSLGDSTYEILSESTFFTSEDEDHEESADWVASNDHDPTDELASLADIDDSKHTLDADYTAVCAESKDGCGDSSTITAKDYNHTSVQAIEFEEAQPYRDAEQVDAIHTVYKFSREEALKVGANAFSSGESVQFVATIRQTMTRQGLLLDRPFRMVYVGDTSAQNVIVEKVGAALAVPSSAGPASHLAHRRSSRFNIIPVSSFGDDTSPEVELIDSSGLEILVDRCTSAEMTEGSGSYSTVTLTLNESTRCQSIREGQGFKVQSDDHWQLPDIAIIYRSNDDALSVRRTCTLAHSFMKNLKVPSIVISEEPLWNTGNVPAMLPYRGPHLCLEARGVNASDNRVLRRLPVDLASFKNIDSGQMNRNLACLTGLHAGKDRFHAMEREHRAAKVMRRSSSADIEKVAANTSWLAQSISRLRKVMRANVRASVLIGALFVYTIAYTFTPMEYLKLRQSLQTAPVPPATALSPIPSAISGTSSIALALATSNSAVSSPVARESKVASLNTVSIRDTNVDLASFRLNPSLISLNESDQFKVQVVGDCHIVLRPPQSFTLRRNRPRISVKVMRNDVIIEHELSKLFETVYVVNLERDHAYGPMNVSVWTKSKPTFNQTFLVDFGTPSLKTHGWKKVMEVMSAQIKNEYNTRLGKLQLMFGHSGDGTLGITRRGSSNATVFPREAMTTRVTPLQRGPGTKDRLALRIRVLSNLLTRQATNHSKQLVKESVRLSKKSLLLSKPVREGVGSQTRDVSAHGAHYLAMLCHAATGVDPAKLWVEFSKIPPVRYQQSLRPVQKAALRVWKRVSGARVNESTAPIPPPKAQESLFRTKGNR